MFFEDLNHKRQSWKDEQNIRLECREIPSKLKLPLASDSVFCLFFFFFFVTKAKYKQKTIETRP